jgi:diguanylate cyclase (GGDEF)-like protein
MKRRTLITALTVGVAALIMAGGVLFSSFVHDSLWEKSVTDVLEVTAQGQNALDTYFEKDLDTLNLFAKELSAQSSADTARIDEKIALFDQNDDDATYVCMNMDSGSVFRSGSTGASFTLTDEQLARIAEQSERGVLAPFIDERTGVKSIGVFEKFTFADGAQGIVRKSRPLQDVADRYSLSFYDNGGFSYVVDDDGTIVLRSTHRNSNRTIANIYDLVEGEGNDEDVIASFHAALDQDKRGVALFTYLGTDYVFCYMPLGTENGWDLVSVIPNDVIMEQANTVIQATFALCAVIIAGLLVILVTYWRSSSAHRRQIEHLAYYDQLTGLYSAVKFNEEGARLLHANVPGVAVAYLNIDDFKLVNDIDGYQRGDDILREVSRILREECGADGIACRSSADHFLLMLPFRTSLEIEQRCGHIVERTRRIVAAGKPLSLRIGICCSTDAPDARTVTELTDRARIAKTQGRLMGAHLCLFNASMRDAMLQRADIERAMEGALAAGEFFPLIQPKFSTDGTRVLGGEALVRWNRPGQGIVNPGDFIPLFEENGFIVKLDEFMFECVCRMLRERLDAGLPVVPISVNVSRVHLHRPSFVPTYVRIKNAYRIPDDLAELELTENMVLEDLDNAVTVIDALRTAGFRSSIDDFGSGQSSLNALKDLPVDVLKLDRTFLLEQARSHKEEVIVRTVIDMARKLDMKTVMEGVETQEQLAFLQSTSCDMIQGFVFSRPIAVGDFLDLVDRSE